MDNHYHFSIAQDELRDAITKNYRRDEEEAVADMLARAQMSEQEKTDAATLARKLIAKVRATRTKASGVDALMHEFSLSSEEGLALMCLAEALLRIPDNATRDKLIRDKISDGNWKSHLHKSPSMFVNAAAWGLMVTGKLTRSVDEQSLSNALTRAIAKGGEPMIRGGVNYAMKLLGKQFVTGQTIEEALKNGKERESRGYLFSFDMLGEAAMTKADADKYFNDYVMAIHAIGKDAAGKGPYEGNGISVKLSAIHPRYWRAQYDRVMAELLPRLKELFMLAQKYDIGLNIDAEEANRYELSLDLMEKIISDPDLAGFKGIGFVVQGYQKRTPFVIDYLIATARKYHQRLMIRLVKGAYWDSEIKWAQVDGIEGYPVYTQKVHTDVSYLACARKLLAAQDAVFPQFATHNAYTLAAIYQMGKGKEFEHQCLNGMGETLYDQVVGPNNLGRHCRIYGPVGTHKTLLAYLVRRLLENGANSSFVNLIVDDSVSIDELVQSPLDQAAKTGGKGHPLVPLTSNLYGKDRKNSLGFDLSNEFTLQMLEKAMSDAAENIYAARSLTASEVSHETPHDVKNPADHMETVGTAAFIKATDVATVIASAVAAQTSWAQTQPSERAAILRKVGDLLQENMPELMHLAVREAGKSLPNAINEIREAIDFCRYYANECETTVEHSQAIGTVVAISPWNFPVAIFTGETIAALAVGNTVITKPAEQTSILAYRTVQLMHAAGIPKDALQLVLGAGDVGAALTADARINGVIFTGSTEVAQAINQTLAKREDLPALIAETGGQNAMIVDSTALPEQVCVDVIQSAFDSAGQRCSALRILCLQEDIADDMLAMIKQAMDELKVGNTRYLATDIGPVIDAEAQANLQKHIVTMKANGHPFHEIALSDECGNGTFVAPILFELNNFDDLQHEVFGPVLHVIRYQSSELGSLIAQINSKGYALTHGIHTRINRTIDEVCQKIEAGNIYVNRNIVGAVVGVQPFGGHGLSGTGPKAGGPFYLQRLAKVSSTWQIPKLSHKGEADEKALTSLTESLVNLPLSGDLQTALDAAREHTLRGAEAQFKGPTGEQNTLYWKAPKAVRVVGGDVAAAVPVLIALAASSITAEIDPAHPLAAYQGKLGSAVTVVPETEDTTNHWVLLDALSPEEKSKLAARKGALVHLIDARDGFDVRRVFAEISLSVNTTAAGGNASLMAQV